MEFFKLYKVSDNTYTSEYLEEELGVVEAAKLAYHYVFDEHAEHNATVEGFVGAVVVNGLYLGGSEISPTLPLLALKHKNGTLWITEEQYDDHFV